MTYVFGLTCFFLTSLWYDYLQFPLQHLPLYTEIDENGEVACTPLSFQVSLRSFTFLLLIKIKYLMYLTVPLLIPFSPASHYSHLLTKIDEASVSGRPIFSVTLGTHYEWRGCISPWNKMPCETTTMFNVLSYSIVVTYTRVFSDMCNEALKHEQKRCLD